MGDWRDSVAAIMRRNGRDTRSVVGRVIIGQHNLAAAPPNQFFFFLLDYRRLMGDPFFSQINALH
jgi:hypothetical protein